MWYPIKSYLPYLLNSQNQHGLHSPFVYKLVTECFYDTSHREAYSVWKNLQKQLFKSHGVIQVKDLGAGSRVFSSAERKISSVAKNAGTTYKRAKFLHRLTYYLKIENALELGTSLGLESVAMGLNKQIQLTTIEACPATAKVAQTNFKQLKLSNINSKIDTFNAFLKNLNQDTKFDLVFIDGHHDGEATYNYFLQLLKHQHNESVFIIDDIYWSKDMHQAWKKIIQHPEVTVSIDTFFWGMIFFRKEQAKQDFKIRL
ncbi:class I SAM-dependent methyltransferase [Psychroflexus sp. C1]|uniref:Class I SAM-dependent methyltransferase n=1 Tax=Psychroflexus maritimus TaxID=2714865 RepID=A0A967DZG7_9FLAO|nr:class I SAM-dependent methyltransferase [Psychroflexus maritimus]